ncbi:MAG TPA: LamG-like jellyroll fold domain-containing protein, partial [Roseimicrobium sp.]|nr:LamG-like jellyroll fold domain-containing protein [Roseimicrobium sp.]
MAIFPSVNAEASASARGRSSQAQLRQVFLLAALSVVAVLGLAYAGSFEKDGLEDSWKATYGMGTHPVAEESLRGWWQLNETNAASAADRSGAGAGNELVLTGVDGAAVTAEARAATWAPGLFDNGARLDGVRYLAAQVPGAYELSEFTGFTFSAWVKTDAADDYQVISRWRDAGGYGWQLDAGAGAGQLRARFDTPGGANQVVQAAAVVRPVKDGGWHQVALTFLPTTGEAKLYLDGKLEATRVIAGPIGLVPAEFRIGDKGWGVAWKGVVDEVRLYRKVLATTEVASLPGTYFDADGDGLNTLREMQAGTDPGKRDTDGDSVPDGVEGALGMNPANPADGAAVGTSGLTQAQYYRAGLSVETAEGAGAIAPERLVGYWPFELNSTNVAPQISETFFVFDHSANSLPGTLRVAPADRAASFGPGKSGNALLLNGNGDVAVEPSQTVAWGDFTASAWVKTSGTASSGAILRWVDAAERGWQIETSDSGTVRARVSTDAQTEQLVQNLSGSAKNIADGAWHHVTLSYVASSHAAYLYVDGTLESTRQIAGNYQNVASQITIGSGRGQSWKGCIDEVRIWDGVLSPTQVATLFSPQLAAGGSGSNSGTTSAGGTGTSGSNGPGTTTSGGTTGITTTTTLSTLAEAPVGNRLAAIVRHRPQVNGKLDGSVQQLLAEDVTLNSGAIITGDLLVPGVPQITQNGSASQITFGGVKTGLGAATPTNHRLTLNSNSTLRYLATRTDAVALRAAEVPKNPTGNRSVNLNGPTDPVGDWATVRDVNCNGNTGTLTVPAGAYGNFNAGGNWVLKLGVADAPAGSAPALYEFQGLNLNSQAKLEIVGPVEIRLRNSFNNNGILGNADHPDWLVFKISNGGVNLNSGSKIYGQVISPSGTVSINGNTLLVGTVRADQLTINSGGELRYTSTSAPPVPVIITVALTAPEPNALLQAPALVQLAATAMATGPVGAAIAKVEFYATPLTGNGPGTKVRLGEDASAAYTYSWSNVPSGAYSLTAVATDLTGTQATSAPVYITVNGQPSVEVTISSPTGVITAGSHVTLTANPADADGVITKVEFYVNGVKVGERTSAPWTYDWTGADSGAYTFAVHVTDDRGGVAISSETVITVNAPPTVALTAPPANATVQLPIVVEIGATAADSDGSVAKVEFFVLNTTVSGSTPVKLGEDTDLPYSFSWPQPEVGSYALTAVATDNHGATSTSEAVAITVQEALIEWFTLKEEEDFAKKKEYSLTIPPVVAGSPAKTTISFRYKDLAFDGTTQTSPISATRVRDGFELALLGADGKSAVPVIGTGRDAFFYSGEGLAAPVRAQGVNVRTEANGEVVVSLSVVGLLPSTPVKLVARLVNDDGDTATEVKVTEPKFTRDSVTAPWAPLAVDPGAAFGAATLDWAQYAAVPAGYGVTTEYNTASWAEKAQVLHVEAGLKNTAPAARHGRHVVVVKGISDPLVRVLNGDGLTPAGESYFDLGAAVTNGKLDAGQISKFRTIQFYNPGGVAFTWSAVVNVVPNKAPTWSSAPITEGFYGKPYVYAAQAADPEGSSVTYSLVAGPGGMAVDSSTGRVTWTPPATGTADSSYGVTLRAADSLQALADQSFTVTLRVGPPNRPPLMTEQPPVDAVAGSAYSFTIAATDPDGDALTYALESGPSGFSVNASTGAVTWTPTLALVGAQPVVLRLSDGRGGVTRHSYSVAVRDTRPANRAPVFVSVPPTSYQHYYDASTELLANSLRYSVRAVDPDGDIITYTSNDAPLTADGTLVISFGYYVLEPFTWTGVVTATDSRGASTTQQISILVTPVQENRAPVFVSQPKLNATVGVPWKYQVSAVDPDGHGVVISVSSDNAAITYDEATGVVSWTPTAADVGSTPFVYISAADNVTSTSQDFQLSVSTTEFANNNPAFVSAPPSGATAPGRTWSYTPKAVDLDSDPLTFSLVSAPDNMAVDEATGGVAWIPAATQSGTFRAVLKVSDGR